jgi:RNA polymerase sigma-70 factor (ECF subfamily)
VVAILEQAFREHWGRVLAALIGFLGDFDLAEEAAQEAFAIAAQRWPHDGEPANPGSSCSSRAVIPRSPPRRRSL